VKHKQIGYDTIWVVDGHAPRNWEIRGNAVIKLTVRITWYRDDLAVHKIPDVKFTTSRREGGRVGHAPPACARYRSCVRCVSLWRTECFFVLRYFLIENVFFPALPGYKDNPSVVPLASSLFVYFYVHGFRWSAPYAKYIV